MISFNVQSLNICSSMYNHLGGKYKLMEQFPTIKEQVGF